MRLSTGILLLASLLILVNFKIGNPEPAYYVWTDEGGRVRFAEDLSQIPEKYKKDAVPGPERRRTRFDTEQLRQQQNTGSQSSNETQSVPKFEVAAQCNKCVSILVPKNTTAEQLRALVFALRDARKSNTLSKIIPPTTRGDRLGDYATFDILVFSELDWAAPDKFKRFVEAESPADDTFYDEYVKHIKAEYSYIAFIPSEKGNLGYSDGMFRSANYESLWKDELDRKIEEMDRKKR